MIHKKDEIQRQILIYLIEDEVVSQKLKQISRNNVIQSVEKQDNYCVSTEGRQSFSINIPNPIISSAHNNVSATKSIHEESCASINSLNINQAEKKKSEDILSDSPQKQKESNERMIKQIKVVNIDTIKYSLQLIGFKYKDAHSFCEILKDIYRDTLSSQVNQQQGLEDAFGKFKMARAYIQQSQLYKGIVEFAGSNNYIKPHKENASTKLIQYFDMCMQILQKKYPLIILLGGTSGTGKSTLSSILASRFQIPTVLSTDSIRHIIRNFMDESEEPILFTSTYEAGKILNDDSITKESKKTIQGYKIQCKLVQQKLEKVISQYAKKNEPMIIEGVHLTPRFMFSMMKKYPYVIPFTICIEKESKHRQRFAVRSKYMTLDKKKNKYIQYISNIRMIQAWFMEKSDEHLIPKINNVNIDKSVNIIHRVVTTYMRKMINYQLSIIPDKSVNALILYKSFNKVIKPLINKFSVSQEVNKSLVMQKFLDNFDKEDNENQSNNGNINNSNININNQNNINSIHNNSNNNWNSQSEQPNQLQVNNYSMENTNGLAPISKVSSSNYSVEAFVVNRNLSPSVDLLSNDNLNSLPNTNSQDKKNIEQIQLSIKKSFNEQSNPQVVFQIPSSQNNSGSKDPKFLLDQLLNDLENKHSKSFVEYTIKKIEDMKQNALKEYQENSPPLLSQKQHTQPSQFKNLSHSQDLLLTLPSSSHSDTAHTNHIVATFKNDIPQISSSSYTNHQNNKIEENQHNNKVNLSQNQPLSVFENVSLNSQKQKQLINNSNLDNQTEDNLKQNKIHQIQQKIDIKLNGNVLLEGNIVKIDENKEIQIQKEVEKIESQLDQESGVNGQKNSLDIIKPIKKKKKKLKMDEKSNQVTIHSSHNEEQINIEQQSEGDSLRMGEDNYQFDVLSEGVEEDEDLRNSEEHSNSIDDEEEDNYHDNFGNQSDESSDLDQERRDYQNINGDDEDEEEYYEDEEDDDEEEEEDNGTDTQNNSSKNIISHSQNSQQIVNLEDLAHQLDPQQLESLNYEGYQHYIKAIKEIVEATVYQQKLTDSNQRKTHIINSKSSQALQKKEFYYSKSLLIHSEEEGKMPDIFEMRKKNRQRSVKHDRQQSFNKKLDGTPQNGSSSMTSSLSNFVKKRTQKSRHSRKNLMSQNLIIQKVDNTENKEDQSPIPIENRAKSCDPDKSNLEEKNFKITKKCVKNEGKGNYYFKDGFIEQIQQDLEADKYDIKN